MGAALPELSLEQSSQKICISCDPEILYPKVMFTQKIPTQSTRLSKGCLRWRGAEDNLDVRHWEIDLKVIVVVAPMEQYAPIAQLLQARVRCIHSTTWINLKNTVLMEKTLENMKYIT